MHSCGRIANEVRSFTVRMLNHPSEMIVVSADLAHLSALSSAHQSSFGARGSCSRDGNDHRDESFHTSKLPAARHRM